MNKLSIEKRSKIIQLLVEGNSTRSCSRIMGVSKCTVTRLLVSVGKACIKFHDETVKNVPSKNIEADELWSYVHTKEKNIKEAEENKSKGDAWVWIGMDADTKLIVSWFVGHRDAETAKFFMQDLSARLKDRVQLTTDGFVAYPEAVRVNFDEVDYCQQDKQYGIGKNKEGKMDRRKRYLGSEKVVVSGNPNPKNITTNHIERQNLTIRMNNKRFARRTNAFSKKIDNHCCSLGLTFTYYNFVRIHQTLKITPAMASGLTKRFMTFEDMVRLTD